MKSNKIKLHAVCRSHLTDGSHVVRLDNSTVGGKITNMAILTQSGSDITVFSFTVTVSTAEVVYMPLDEFDALGTSKIARYILTTRRAVADLLNAKSQECNRSANFYTEYPDATFGYAIGKLNAKLVDFYLELARAIMPDVE